MEIEQKKLANNHGQKMASQKLPKLTSVLLGKKIIFKNEFKFHYRLFKLIYY